MRVCFWVLEWVPLICVSVPLATPQSWLLCLWLLSLQLDLFLLFFFFFKNVLAILVALTLNINCRIIWSISTKKLAGILIEIVLNLYISLERTDICLHGDFQFKNRVCLSIYSDLVWFFSFSSFQHTIAMHVLFYLYTKAFHSFEQL